MSIVILDTRPREAYEAGHLPGAQHADVESQLSSASTNPNAANGGRHPLPPLERWLQQVAEWGIGPDTTVYVYDDQQGANAATRAWWMLRAIGHQKVEVLLQWKDSDLEATPLEAAEPYRVAEWQWPTVDMRQVDRLRLNPAWRVLDVRSAERFRGETEPIDPVAGHIPGAINKFFGENLESGAFKSPEALRAMYLGLLGNVLPERLVVHCGSGVTACHTLFALERAGLSGASLYVGSWGEWCRNEMPIARS